MTRTIAWAPGTPRLGPSVVAMGVFDGVHVGHRALLSETRALARSEGVQAVALTFDSDPDEVLHRTHAHRRILAPQERIALLARQGLDAVLVVPFDEELSSLSPGGFLDEVLAPAVEALVVVVGLDFRFGAGGAGDVDTLRAAGSERGWRVAPHELVAAEGAPVTATRIRDLVAAGDVATAARLLDRPFAVGGLVVRGRGVGARLGAPTANLEPGPLALVPGDGVYAARVALRPGHIVPAGLDRVSAHVRGNATQRGGPSPGRGRGPLRAHAPRRVHRPAPRPGRLRGRSGAGGSHRQGPRTGQGIAGRMTW